MNNVISFPSKDERQWNGVAHELEMYLGRLGASADELPVLLPKLRAHWDTLGAPYELGLSHQLVGPLTDEQLQSINAAMRAQAAEIVAHQKVEHAATLLRFAELEYAVLRLGN